MIYLSFISSNFFRCRTTRSVAFIKIPRFRTKLSSPSGGKGIGFSDDDESGVSHSDESLLNLNWNMERLKLLLIEHIRISRWSKLFKSPNHADGKLFRSLISIRQVWRRSSKQKAFNRITCRNPIGFKVHCSTVVPFIWLTEACLLPLTFRLRPFRLAYWFF